MDLQIQARLYFLFLTTSTMELFLFSSVAMHVIRSVNAVVGV